MEEPAFSHDGRQIVFGRVFADYDGDLFLVGVHDGHPTSEPRRLTYDHQSKHSPIWTNNGDEITYIAGELFGDRSIWRVRVSGGKPQRIEGVGTDATSLTLAPQADRLLYSTYAQNYDIRRIDLNTPGEAKPERFLSSTRYEASPSYSPDGARVAFDSNRGGVRQIWVADFNGANPVPLTSFASGIAGSPKWSPDSQFIVFDARPGSDSDIYTVPVAGGPVKKLTDFPGEDNVPSWSPDGKWIYFGSRRTGRHEIFRMRPDGSSVQQITQNEGGFGMVTADGRWLYYSVRENGLWKMPSDGGPSTRVLPKEALYKTLSFTLDAKGIYTFGKAKDEAYPVVFYPFDGGKSRKIATLIQPIENFPTVSPDGRYLAYSSPDNPNYGIMLVDNFR